MGRKLPGWSTRASALPCTRWTRCTTPSASVPGAAPIWTRRLPATRPSTRRALCWTRPWAALPPTPPTRTGVRHDALLPLPLQPLPGPLLQGDCRRRTLAALLQERAGGGAVRGPAPTPERGAHRRAGRGQNLRAARAAPPAAPQRLPPHLLPQRHPGPARLLPPAVPGPG